MNTCYLSTAYWAPIHYYTKLLAFNKVVIEQYETYPKQSYRNRMKIYGVNGIQSLQVPVLKGSFKNMLIKDLEISYADNWQKNHLKTIESAYRSAPFYEYYIDDIMPFYNTKYKFLIDYNMKIIEESLLMLDVSANIEMSANFFQNLEFDFRNAIHPKPEKNKEDKSFKAPSYIQGFEQRHGFVENLSILDLIFNTGPEATGILRSSII